MKVEEKEMNSENEQGWESERGGITRAQCGKTGEQEEKPQPAASRAEKGIP